MSASISIFLDGDRARGEWAGVTRADGYERALDPSTRVKKEAAGVARRCTSTSASLV